jgi:hypothetical protein
MGRPVRHACTYAVHRRVRLRKGQKFSCCQFLTPITMRAPRRRGGPHAGLVHRASLRARTRATAATRDTSRFTHLVPRSVAYRARRVQNAQSTREGRDVEPERQRWEACEREARRVAKGEHARVHAGWAPAPLKSVATGQSACRYRTPLIAPPARSPGGACRLRRVLRRTPRPYEERSTRRAPPSRPARPTQSQSRRWRSARRRRHTARTSRT